MGQVQAVMFTVNTYGTWLRGDARGWIEKGVLFPPDPSLEAADRARMKWPPYLFSQDMRWAVGNEIGRSYIQRLRGTIHAMHVGRWHIHLMAAMLDVPMGEQVKCIKDAVRWFLKPGRPIWSDGYDKRFCYDTQSVLNRIAYVHRHNIEDKLPEDPWEFITPVIPSEPTR